MQRYSFNRDQSSEIPEEYIETSSYDQCGILFLLVCFDCTVIRPLKTNTL